MGQISRGGGGGCRGVLFYKSFGKSVNITCV